MVERSQLGEAGAAELGGSAAARVWQACVACRRKKVKCDGKQPCHNCSSREHACEFPGTKDNASISRQYTFSFESRCQQMDNMCVRLETLANQLAQSITALNNRKSPCSTEQQQASSEQELVHAAELLRSMPDINSLRRRRYPKAGLNGGPTRTSAPDPSPLDDMPPTPHMADTLTDSDDGDYMDDGGTTQYSNGQAGALLTDSYGRLRFVGGTTNNIMFEAVKSLSPENIAPNCTPSTISPTPQGNTDPEEMGIPPLIGKRVWPQLPFLPKPKQLSKVPQYASDLLIGLYFEKLHHSFPILHKPRFMERYRQVVLAGPDDPASTQDPKFLSVYYAVCACGSTLLPSNSDRGFPGIEHYEKSVLLYYSLTGEASLERVQCLGLLAMCTAGWNTMTQSWFWSGQAVRAAQDMGLHLSSRLMLSLTSAPRRRDAREAEKQQMFRRVWWSVCCLDKIVSMCLGRPTAAHDRDCSCELPLDLTDEDLQTLDPTKKGQLKPRERDAGSNVPSTWMAGFLAFAHLCRIADSIQRLGAPVRTHDLGPSKPDSVQEFARRVATRHEALRRWHQSLPEDLCFPLNTHNWRPVEGHPVMRVILFTLYAGAKLNLNLVAAKIPNCVNPSDARLQTVDAARSLISAAGLVRDLVPQSHYLAFCLHYMMIAGIVLIRSPEQQLGQQPDADVENCVSFFRDMEPRCSAANRYRAIIEQLKLDCQQRRSRSDDLPRMNGNANLDADGMGGSESANNTTRFADLAASTAAPQGEWLFWNNIPGWDMFPVDALDPGLFNPLDGTQMMASWGE